MAVDDAVPGLPERARLDRGAVLRGAGLILACTLPVSLVARLLPRSVDLAPLVVLVVLVASFAGGVVTAQRTLDRPIAHAAVAGMAASAVIAVIALVRLSLTRGVEVSHVVFLLLLFQIMAGLALLGGLVVSRRRSRPTTQ